MSLLKIAELQGQLARRDARMAQLEAEVSKYRDLYEKAVQGRKDMRDALVVGRSLLREPVKSIADLKECYCPPDKCGAPVIMGRQTPCIRKMNAAKHLPADDTEGGAL